MDEKRKRTVSEKKNEYKVNLNQTIEEVKIRKNEFKLCEAHLTTELESKNELLEEQKNELDHKERDLRALFEANQKFTMELNNLKDDLSEEKRAEAESQEKLVAALIASPPPTRIVRSGTGEFDSELPASLTPSKRTRKDPTPIQFDVHEEESSTSSDTSITMNISSESSEIGTSNDIKA